MARPLPFRITTIMDYIHRTNLKPVSQVWIGMTDKALVVRAGGHLDFTGPGFKHAGTWRARCAITGGL